MRKFICFICFAFVLVSCQRDPIYSSVSKYRFEFPINDSVLYLKPELPPLVQVSFYNTETGKRVKENSNIPMKPEGGYLMVQPGRYNIVAFGMVSSLVNIIRQDDFNLVSAQTDLISSYPKRISKAPDHLFVGVARDVEIPYLTDGDPDFVFRLPLSSVCDSWMVEVSGIKGLSNLSSLQMHVGSQSESVTLCDMSLYGNSHININQNFRVVDSLLQIPFCTFGMPAEGPVSVQVDLLAMNGILHTKTIDSSSQVYDPENRKHIIRFDMDTVLLPLEQGGLRPVNDPWHDIVERIELE